MPAVRVPGLALQGILLFLFIPLVLVLFLRQPLGPGWSVGIGLAIMLGHRFVAQPWAAKFADVRCLWCGRAGAAVPVAVLSGGRRWPMRACSDRHATLVRRFLAFLYRLRAPIALGIFVPLAWLLAASLAAAAGHPLLPHATSARLFRLVVAVTVIVASAGPLVPLRSAARAEPGPEAGTQAGAGSLADEPARCPFPLHNLFLLGIGKTLWIFRVVGAWWLADALLRR